MQKPGESSRQGEATVAGSVNRLTAQGYTDWFKAEPGVLRAVTAGCAHPPEAFCVAAVLRFEGESDPDDEAIVFALECRAHRVKGTYTVAYGVNTPSVDMDLVRRLDSEFAAASASMRPVKSVSGGR